MTTSNNKRRGSLRSGSSSLQQQQSLVLSQAMIAAAAAETSTTSMLFSDSKSSSASLGVSSSSLFLGDRSSNESLMSISGGDIETGRHRPLSKVVFAKNIAQHKNLYHKSTRNGGGTSSSVDIDEGDDEDNEEGSNNSKSSTSEGCRELTRGDPGIRFMRILVYFTLLLSAALVSSLVYFYCVKTERDEFEQTYQTQSADIRRALLSETASKLSSIENFATNVQSHALNEASKARSSSSSSKEEEDSSSSSWWPLVTVPEFSYKAVGTLLTSRCLGIALVPIVEGVHRNEWDSYSVQQAEQWRVDGLKFQQRFPTVLTDHNDHNHDPNHNNNGTTLPLQDNIHNNHQHHHHDRLLMHKVMTEDHGIYKDEDEEENDSETSDSLMDISKSIFHIVDQQPDYQTGEGPFYPLWQHFPNHPGFPWINFNMATNFNDGVDINATITSGQVVLGSYFFDLAEATHGHNVPDISDHANEHGHNLPKNSGPPSRHRNLGADDHHHHHHHHHHHYPDDDMMTMNNGTASAESQHGPSGHGMDDHIMSHGMGTGGGEAPPPPQSSGYNTATATAPTREPTLMPSAMTSIEATQEETPGSTDASFEMLEGSMNHQSHQETSHSSHNTDPSADHTDHMAMQHHSGHTDEAPSDEQPLIEAEEEHNMDYSGHSHGSTQPDAHSGNYTDEHTNHSTEEVHGDYIGHGMEGGHSGHEMDHGIDGANIEHMSHASGPALSLWYPLFDNFDGNRTVVALLMATVAWDTFFLPALPHAPNGIHVVVHNACNQIFTFKIDATMDRVANMIYLGPDDHHEDKYDRYRFRTELTSPGTAFSQVPLNTEHCPWTVDVYPSTEMEQAFYTNQPALFAAVVASLFVFTIFVFLLFDYFGERRREYLVELALEKNAFITQANQQIAFQARRQLEHFACMSHEIRTPLNCIVGLSSLLLDSPDEEEAVPESVMDTVQMIYTSADLLNGVVDDVLDYAKMESGNIVVERGQMLHLQDTLRGVFCGLASCFEKKDIQINTKFGATLPRHIETDPRRLQQILYNLLSNACKFSNVGSSIDFTVVLEESPTSEKIVKMIVKDYGKGIARENIESIFEPFSKCSKETQTIYGGTGLGLSITKTLVEKLGGTISVDSVEGEFTEFVIEFPFNGHPVDVEGLKMQLQHTSIVFLAENSSKDACVFSDEVVGVYGLNLTKVSSWKEIFEISELASPFAIVAPAEDLDQSQWERISMIYEGCILITYGKPSSCPPSEAAAHWGDFEKIFPSVALQSLVTCMGRTKLSASAISASSIEMSSRSAMKEMSESSTWALSTRRGLCSDRSSRRAGVCGNVSARRTKSFPAGAMARPSKWKLGARLNDCQEEEALTPTRSCSIDNLPVDDKETNRRDPSEEVMRIADISHSCSETELDLDDAELGRRGTIGSSNSPAHSPSRGHKMSHKGTPTRFVSRPSLLEVSPTRSRSRRKLMDCSPALWQSKRTGSLMDTQIHGSGPVSDPSAKTPSAKTSLFSAVLNSEPGGTIDVDELQEAMAADASPSTALIHAVPKPLFSTQTTPMESVTLFEGAPQSESAPKPLFAVATLPPPPAPPSGKQAQTTIDVDELEDSKLSSASLLISVQTLSTPKPLFSTSPPLLATNAQQQATRTAKVSSLKAALAASKQQTSTLSATTTTDVGKTSTQLSVGSTQPKSSPLFTTKVEASPPSHLNQLAPKQQPPESASLFSTTARKTLCKTPSADRAAGPPPPPSSSSTAPNNQSRSSSRARNISVLYAEDNAINQKVLSRMLARLGVKDHDIVGDGKQAVEITAKKHYDLIFMDIQMPVMDGLEATKLIKKRDGDKIKIVFCTAHAVEEFRKQADKTGCDGFVCKPFKMKTIEEFLNEHEPKMQEGSA